MKKIGLLLTFTLFFMIPSNKAQTPLTEAEDFMVKDTQGQVHNLFSILDDGKIAVLTFFTTT